MLYGSASATERRTMPPAVAVSTVAFALRPPAGATLGRPRDLDGGKSGGARLSLWLPLVRRTREPFRGCWALPGGPTEWFETLTDTALRTLRAAVTVDPGYLEQLYSFGGVERSAQAQRLVTIAYWATYGEQDLAAPGGRSTAPEGAAPESGQRPRPRRWDDPEPHAGRTPVGAPAGSAGVSPAATTGAPGAPGASEGGSERAIGAEGDATIHDPNVAWFPAEALPDLAFDHAEIVAYALARLRSKTEYAAVAHRFLGEAFTIGQLRVVTEAVSGRTVDPANFRRQTLARGTLIDTGRTESGASHRPARLYRFRDESDGCVGSGTPAARRSRS